MIFFSNRFNDFLSVVYVCAGSKLLVFSSSICLYSIAFRMSISDQQIALLFLSLALSSFLLFFFFLGLQDDKFQLACQKESEWLDVYRGHVTFPVSSCVWAEREILV